MRADCLSYHLLAENCSYTFMLFLATISMAKTITKPTVSEAESI